MANRAKRGHAAREEVQPKSPPPWGFEWTASTVRVLRQEAKQGNVKALSQLGTLFLDGLRSRNGAVLIRGDVRTGRRMLERAIELGDAEAFFVFGPRRLHPSGSRAPIADGADAAVPVARAPR